MAPNSITFSKAISARETDKLPHMAIVILAEMQQKGLAPRDITYHSAIIACEEDMLLHRRWCSVLRYHRKAGTNSITYCAAIVACVKGKLPHTDMAFLAEVQL